MYFVKRIGELIGHVFNFTNFVTERTEKAIRICWDNLTKVSRSFALVIKSLPEGLDKQVMVGYEILRTVDTIEDSLLPSEERKEAFELFREILSGKDGKRYVVKLQRMIDKGVHTPLDKTVTSKIVPNIFTALNSLGEEQQEIIKGTAIEMSRGMEREDFKDIQNLQHHDEYCHYVAGIVGIMLTDLFKADGRLTESQYRRIYLYSEPYGLGLQKVNILKDMHGDIK
ncbi:MAG TPA: hypothetical protein EYP29_03745, partial [Thermoplasmata archaeon]|nr:hypothetical protein [Thermoplasmata archaeon]